MRVYVQGISALSHYRNAEAKLAIERTGLGALRLDEATASIADIRSANTSRLGIEPIDEDHPLHVLVASAGKRGKSKSVTAHVWKTPISGNAFRMIDEELYVSSPEYVFLQMATVLPLPRLIALGMELCGTYRRHVYAPHADGKPGYITEFDQPKLTTPRRIAGFLNAMSGSKGIKAAREALTYVIPNSASPMETIVYILMCLPPRMGGYSLAKPQLNPPITINAGGKRFTIRKSAKPDLLWRDGKIDLEYNGGPSHGEDRRAADSMRRKALEHMHIEVIELTNEEVLSVSVFHAIVLRVARHLGKRIRPESEGDFATKRAALRETLFEEFAKDDVLGSKESTESKQLEDDWTDAFDGIDEDFFDGTEIEVGFAEGLDDADVAYLEEFDGIDGEAAGDFDGIDPEASDDFDGIDVSSKGNPGDIAPDVFDDEDLHVFGGRRSEKNPR